MSEEFKEGAADRLLDKVDADSSGTLKKLVADLMETTRQLSKAGIPMDEIAATVTMAWYIGQNPEMENMLKALGQLNTSDGNNYN